MKQKSITAHVLLLTCLSVILFSATASAFDGNRQGFVMGFGLGVSPISHWNVESLSRSGTEQGTAGGIVLGYAWNNRNVIAYVSNVNFFYSENRKILVCSHAVSAVTWYHYFKDSKHSWYFKGGLGRAYVGSRYSDVGGAGFGIVVGTGVELFKQVELGTNLFYGTGKDTGSHSASVVSLSFVVTALAY